MLKKIFALCLLCVVLCSCSNDKNDKKEQAQKPQVQKEAAVETLDVNYTAKKYVGRYVLRVGLHPNDPFVLNHMVAYKNQQIQYVNGKAPDYMWYDLYCDHDHNEDVFKVEKDYEIRKINFTGYIVPLNIKGQPMQGSGKSIQNSVIVSKAFITTRGTWGFDPVGLKTYNNVDKNLIMEIKGYAGSEELYKNSAAVEIVNISGPHKEIKQVAGHKEYKYR